MGNKVMDELLSTVKSIVGSEYSEMDIIRALHLAKNDATAAINIMFDSSSFRSSDKRQNLNTYSESRRVLNSESKPDTTSTSSKRFCSENDYLRLEDSSAAALNSTPSDRTVERETGNLCSTSDGNEWWLIECCEVAGLSTCKRKKLNPGDEVVFTFPSRTSFSSPSSGRVLGRGRHMAVCSEIVRFSIKDLGEIGRIPNEWARCLLPLVRDNKVRIEGCCKYAPDALAIMDTIILSVRIYINSLMIQNHQQISLKAASSVNEDSVVHPLPALFRLLGLLPYKKAQFTPGDFCTKKRPLNPKDGSSIVSALAHTSKIPPQNGNEDDTTQPISDTDLENIVGVGHDTELEEMDPPLTLQCELRPYQKQALHWMNHLEKGQHIDEGATTLHPCWEAYRLAEKNHVVYVNAFSGEATAEFPSTLEMARGGILADAMGLGKTIMTISLLLAHSKKGSQPKSMSSDKVGEFNDFLDQSPDPLNKSMKLVGFDKLLKQRNNLVNGGSLIICPMTLLGQWKAEIETHVQPGSLSLYVHYGQARTKDARVLAQNDVVITTYGVLASEFSAENSEESGLYSVRWFRVVLDEAHTIKSSKSQLSMAATALVADCRWCLTGTPIQNSLEDIFSLLRFLRIEPWGHLAWWNKLIQKPVDDGDEKALKLVQSILKPIMLRRTKFSTDREGRPILVLPPANTQVVYCELTEAEKDFYEALFKRSKVKFDQFVEQGRVLHNYASILELLLRLRQCCDHPFLVMSRSDTQEFSDLNKLAKRFLRGNESIQEMEAKDVPSRAYIQEVVEELRSGEQGECPICLEAFEDAVLTPCAHRLCRECILASWRNSTTGLCPVCRKTICKQELITAPTENRFQVDIEKNWVESSKVVALLNELESLRSSGSKSIVFSQWTAFLDLLQIPFSRNNIAFLRLDGTLSQRQREKVLKQFCEDSKILVLLMSLKAGGVGINLTAASNAFVLDPWWNPAVEEQAVMRIHRIGQTKSVTIKRFIVKGTVEERMEAVQARKQRLISGALTDQEVRSARIEELKMLFT